MKLNIFLIFLLSVTKIQNVSAFGVTVSSSCRRDGGVCIASSRSSSVLFMSDDGDAAAVPDAADIKFSSEEEKEKMVGNLVADDEWDGLSMQLTEVISTAIQEDIKKNAREFIGKDEYKVGDITKEVDVRVKEELAKMRGKEEYELGDFSMIMHETSIKMVEDMTGKPYEFGDLSSEVDSRIKDATASFCGKEEYEFGDLSSAIDSRVKAGVSEWTGKDDYEFGDIASEIENRRKDWAKEFLGEDAAANYEFGDLTKKALTNWTGKDDYQFGDVTKKLMGNFFGKKKK